MRTTFSTLVALASSAQLASATFSNAKSFSCPSNTNNQCNSDQSSGFNWGSLNLGSFSTYGDFNFNGWSCASSFGGGQKRDLLTGRTFQNKCITHTATPKGSASFGCGSSKSVDAFSVNEFEISTEFDCDLEFHYSMGDGSTCKQKHSCSKSGTVVKNSQCGGAKSVSVVYPTQTAGSGKGKTSCSIGVHSIGFDCSTSSKTVVRSSTTKSSTKQTYAASSPASSKATTTSVPVKDTTTSKIEKPSTSTTVAGVTSSVPETTPATTSVPETTPISIPSFSNTTVIASTSTTPVVETTPVAETTPVVTPSTTAFTTSTVFTTFVSTVISCAETVKNCPASSTVLTTVSVAISTTICPVTSTEVPVSSTTSAEGVVSTTPVSSPVVSEAVSSTTVEATPVSSYTPVESDFVTTVVVGTTTTVCPFTSTHVTGGSTSVETSTIVHTTEGTTSVETSTIAHVTGGSTSIEVGTTTSTVVVTSTATVCTKCEAGKTTTAVAGVTTTTPAGPVETAPCPDVLPSCLNTWLFSEGCSSNTDSDCYCPSATFVSNIFECLSAHGASDSEIASAQTYFQGICAPHIPSNPAIVTGASSYVVTATSGAVTSYVPSTTIQIFTTLTVPCTETTGISSGSIIPSSSTITVLSTAVTVPQVVFTTVAGATTAGELVAGTPAPVSATTTLAIPASTTLTVSSTSNGTVKASATPSQLLSSNGVQTTFTLSSISAAFFLALLAL